MQGSGEERGGRSVQFHFLLVPAKIGKRLWRVWVFGPLLFGKFLFGMVRWVMQCCVGACIHPIRELGDEEYWRSSFKETRKVKQ